MKTLSSRSFAAARSYILTHGRPLDRRLFAYHFESGDRAAVLAELSAYQNVDGGFGRALEPDLRTPASSAIATSQGLAILRDVGAPAGDDLVCRAVAYLMDVYDAERQVWPIIPPQAEDGPHAPWWSYAEAEVTFRGFFLNPRAELLGHLYHFAVLVPADFLGEATKALVDHLRTTRLEMSMNDLLSCLSLVQTDDLPDEARSVVLEKVIACLPDLLVSDPMQWGDYCLKPLDVASRPDSPVAAAVDSDLIEAQLEYEIRCQQDDGSWPLAWSWEFVDEAAWAQAERDWKGHLAVEKLKVLRAYRRLEEGVS